MPKMLNAMAEHLIVLPIVVPLLAGTLLLFLAEGWRRTRAALTIASVSVQLLVAAVLLYFTSDWATDIWTEGVGVYQPGAWPVPFGIVLVVDPLSAVMLALSTTIAFATLVYSISRWDRPGQSFHSLFQFLTMGLNGAFLTGDLFNLFVFFEVLLAASYGLVLRGMGAPRVKAGLHYIAVNFVASFLFLIGVAVIYGVAGTLNMADLAGRAASLAPGERGIMDAGAAIMGIAFLIKAGSWPLNFWLPPAYSVVVAPVAAAFGMMTKVGLYAILRVGTLLGEDERLGAALLYIGLATLVSGVIALLAAKHLPRLIAYSMLVSMGIMLAALGLRIDALTGPVLYYMIISVLTTATFFMVAGMTDRARRGQPAAQAAEAEAGDTQPLYAAYGILEPSVYREDEEVGMAIPAAMAFLGLMFVCCVLLVTGLPPLPGFVAKFALLSLAVREAPGAGISASVWIFCGAVLVSGFAGILSLSQIGMRLFWSAAARSTPRLRLTEAAPVAGLLLLSVAIGVAADPVSQYLGQAGQALHEPDTYVRVVLSRGAMPIPGGDSSW